MEGGGERREVRGRRPSGSGKSETARRKSVTVKGVSRREKIGNDWLGRTANGEEQQSHSSSCGGIDVQLTKESFALCPLTL